ncbi:MAG: MFS transporter [bacterium]|nr:MFS transporter [bacterium]
MSVVPRDTYPDRRWVFPLATTLMIGYGVILYGFSVYATDQAAGADFSTTTLSLGYGGSVFVGGLLAIPIGHLADKRGVRVIFGIGALFGGLGLALFAISNEPWQVVAAWWLLLGPAQAMIYYEPAFVAIDQWSSPVDRARTLATITLIGGLAGILFIPLIAWLMTIMSWRSAVLLLGLLLFVVGEITALVALPIGTPGRMTSEASDLITLPALLRDRRFVLYTVALMLSLLAVQSVIAHRVARFEETGFPVTTVALWASVASALSLPGRWIAPRLAERFGATRVQALIAVIVAVSVLLMVDGTSHSQMVFHFFLFGLALGALVPLRAMVMGSWFSGPGYGRIMGTQWSAVVLVAAAGPFLVGTVRDTTGDYSVSFYLLAAVLLVAAIVIVASGRRELTR